MAYFLLESLIGKVTETIHACCNDFLSEISLHSLPNTSYMYLLHSSCKTCDFIATGCSLI